MQSTQQMREVAVIILIHISTSGRWIYDWEKMLKQHIVVSI